MTQLIKFDKPAEYYVEQVLQLIREGEQNPLDIKTIKVQPNKQLNRLKILRSPPQPERRLSRWKCY